MKKLLLIIPILIFGQEKVLKELETITTEHSQDGTVYNTINLKEKYNSEGQILEMGCFYDNQEPRQTIFKYEKGYLIEKGLYWGTNLAQKIKYYRNNNGDIIGGYLSEFFPYQNPKGIGECSCPAHTYVFCESIGAFVPIEETPEYIDSHCEAICEYHKYTYSLAGQSFYDGNSTYKNLESFNSKGQLIETTNYNKGHGWTHCTFKYNTNGDLIERDCCCDWLHSENFDGDIGRIVTFEYEYDSNGNKLTEEVFSTSYEGGGRDKVIKKEKGVTKRFKYDFDNFDNIQTIKVYHNNNLRPSQITKYIYTYYSDFSSDDILGEWYYENGFDVSGMYYENTIIKFLENGDYQYLKGNKWISIPKTHWEIKNDIFFMGDGLGVSKDQVKECSDNAIWYAEMEKRDTIQGILKLDNPPLKTHFIMIRKNQ